MLIIQGMLLFHNQSILSLLIQVKNLFLILHIPVNLHFRLPFQVIQHLQHRMRASHHYSLQPYFNFQLKSCHLACIRILFILSCSVRQVLFGCRTWQNLFAITLTQKSYYSDKHQGFKLFKSLFIFLPPQIRLLKHLTHQPTHHFDLFNCSYR